MVVTSTFYSFASPLSSIHSLTIRMTSYPCNKYEPITPPYLLSVRSRSHDPFLRIRFLLVPKIGSCEHIENDLPTHGSLILEKRMEIEHALFSPDTLLER